MFGLDAFLPSFSHTIYYIVLENLVFDYTDFCREWRMDCRKEMSRICYSVVVKWALV